MMKPPIAMLLLMQVASQVALAEIPSGWSTNYVDILSVAHTNQPSSLLYFTASWCGPCKLMARTTLAAPAVAEALSHLDHIALDIDEHSDLATQYGVEAVPTMVLLSAGHEVDRSTGYQPIGDFMAWLTNGIAAANASAARLARARSTLAEVDRLLGSSTTNSAPTMAAKLLDLCAEHENSVATAAAGRLRTLALRDPASVLDGLNDARLAVRLRTANVLHDILGNAFDLDPWENEATRHNAVEIWRAKLIRQTSR